MNRWPFLIAVCTLLLLEVSLTSAQYEEEDCPYNEVDVDCVSNCNTCEFVNKTCRTTDGCEAGCDCKPGYLRNKFGYCIPRRYCGATSDVSPAEGGREVGNSGGGCPSSQFCVLSCKRRGFGTGICLGPRQEFCNCYTAPPPPDPAGQETPGNREVADSGGCPNAQLCTLSCKRRAFTSGLCLGPGLGYCNCFTGTQVSADGKREVASSGGCPSSRTCILSCKRRNFETGVCLGPMRGYCNCYSSSNSRNHGCPQRSLCEAYCKRRRYATGICLGDRRLDCKCSGILD